MNSRAVLEIPEEYASHQPGHRRDFGNTGNYMQLYLSVVDRRIDDIRYLCSCEPTANVAVEILCTLARGKTLEEAAAVSEQAFYEFLGCSEEEYKIKSRGLLEMLNEGIADYKKRRSA